jgi:hypothetical protein
MQESVGESFSENLSFQSGDDDASVLRTGGRGRGYSKSITYKMDAIVPPSDFRNLGDGEAIYIGRNSVYKIQVPLVHLNIEDKEIDMPRYRMPHKQGLGISEMFQSMAMGGAPTSD